MKRFFKRNFFMNIFLKATAGTILAMIAASMVTAGPIQTNNDPGIAEKVERTQDGTLVTDRVTETFLKHFDFGSNEKQEPQDREDDESSTDSS